MKALILAAGEGTRLRPLTLVKPKPMLPVAGQPLIEHIITWLRSYGVEQIVINLHYKPETITSYFGDGHSWGVKIIYSYEDPILGTAGAAKKLQDFLDQSFLVVYGDVLTDLDLKALVAFHRIQIAACASPFLTMALYCVPNPTEVGLVELSSPDGGLVTRFLEKPRPEEVFTNLANAGVLVVEPGILDHIPSGVFYDFGHDLLPKLLEEGMSMYGWPVPNNTYLIDIGSPEKYERVQKEWPVISRRCR